MPAALCLYRARLCAKEPIALDVLAETKRHGYEIVGAKSKNTGIKCISAVYKLFEKDCNTGQTVGHESLSLAMRLFAGHPVFTDRVVNALYGFGVYCEVNGFPGFYRNSQVNDVFKILGCKALSDAVKDQEAVEEKTNTGKRTNAGIRGVYLFLEDSWNS